MRTAIAQHDWTGTSLEGPERWPVTLKTMLAQVLDTAFPMMIMWGPELTQVYNDGFIPIFGDKHPQSLGQSAEQCWAEIWGEVGPLLLGVYERGEAVFFENLPLTMRRHGRYGQAYFTFSYSPIREHDVVRGIMCVVNETTAHILREREAAERADMLAEIDRVKTEFFNNVSHEFRTPLTLMLGPLEQLVRSLDDSDQRANAELARRNALRLLRLVNTLLDVARLEAGRYDANYTWTDLAKLTLDLCGLFRSAIESAGLRFVVDINMEQHAYVDRSMWEKIVLNLLSNALKFTLEGEIRVTLRAVGDSAELLVGDTGVGIAGDDLPHVFERFRRMRALKSRSHEGSGIGLALVKELVHLHGGSVNVSSVVGVGTTFTVHIPLARVSVNAGGPIDATRTSLDGIAEQYLADMPRPTEAPQAAAAPDANRRARILVADDNADLREYLARILTPYYDVAMAADGREALEFARANTVDLLISDVMMPDVGGFELLRAVRTDKNLADLPFVMLSARAGEEAQIEGLNRGADDYLVKPFSADELLARIHTQLERVRRTKSSFEDSVKRWFERPGDSRTSEIAFRAFADQLPFMIYQHDASGALSFANAAWHKALNMPFDDTAYTLEAWKDLIHPEDLDLVLDSISAAIPLRSEYEFEYRVKPVDGGDETYRWYIARAVPQFDSAGAFRGWLGSLTDVHDARLREESERALREAAAKGESDFRALAETIPVIIWTADASGWIDWYNRRWYEYTGQTPEEAAGWGWQSAHHPDDLPRVMEEWPRSIATGTPFEAEFRLKRADGSFHTVLTRAIPVRQDGKIVRWYGSNVDIEAQKTILHRTQRIAETLQGVFLPERLPHTENIRIDAVYQAAEEDALVGGDWFDAVQMSDGRYMISIGDVTGHGLDASVIAGRLRHAIADFSLNKSDPAAVLECVNEVLRFEHPGIFATASVAFLDRDCSSFCYAGAGHPAPLLAVSADAPARELDSGGLPLGVAEQLGITAHIVDVPCEAVIVLYTDGITEFDRDIEGATARLKVATSRLVGDKSTARPAAAVRDAVLLNGRTSDDLALLVLQFTHIDTDRQQIDATARQKKWRFHSSDVYAAHAAREQLMKFVRLFSDDDEGLFAAELVIGEILANTVEHAPGLVEIDIDWSKESPVLTARDAGPGLNELNAALPADALSESGRGLFLIHALASDVSVRRSRGYGTEIKAVLPLARRA